jgi:hypothetical protein
VVLLVEDARVIHNDVWPKRGPWGSRVVEIEIVQVWPFERSLLNGV